MLEILVVVSFLGIVYMLNAKTGSSESGRKGKNPISGIKLTPNYTKVGSSSISDGCVKLLK